MDEKMMNKLDDMEMELDDKDMELDKVTGGKHSGCCRKLPVAGGHKITMAANVDETQNASACVR